MRVNKRHQEISSFLGTSIFHWIGVNGILGLAAALMDGLVALSMTSLLSRYGLLDDGAGRGISVGFLSSLGWLGFMFLLFSSFMGRACVAWACNFYRMLLAIRFRSRHRLIEVSKIFEEQSQESGEAVAYFGNVVSYGGDALVHQQWLIQLTATSAGLATVLLWRSAPLFCALISLNACVYPMVRYFNRKTRTLSEYLKSYLIRMIKVYSRVYRNTGFFEFQGLRTKEERILSLYVRKSQINATRVKALAALQSPLIQLVGGLTVVASVILAKRFNLGSSSFLVSYLYLFLRFVSTLSMILSVYSDSLFHFPYLRQIWSKWQAAETEQKNSRVVSTQSAVALKTAPAWKVQGLAFAYPSGSGPVFNRLDLEIPAGTLLAVVGESGIGKSTLLNLLIGRLRPNAGSVQFWNGAHWHEAYAYRQSLYASCGYLNSEGLIINGTIEENLRFSRSDNNDFDAALRMTGCSFIGQLPLGLKTRLKENGSPLSSGEVQRLCLARAIHSKPKILFLDEATGKLDLETERGIAQAMRRLLPETTLIVATHRTAFVEVADQVLELSAEGDHVRVQLFTGPACET